MSKWTSEEEEILRKHSLDLSRSELKEKFFPHRTTRSIGYKQKYLGLSFKRDEVFWTLKEESQLRKNSCTHTISELKEKFFPDKSKTSIREKCRENNLEYKYSVPFWTEQEVLLLRKKCKEHSIRELSENFFPDRDYLSVKGKLNRMGLSAVSESKKWTARENEILRNFYPMLSNEKIQEEYLPHRTKVAIKDQAYSLGLNKLNYKERNKYSRSGEKWTSNEVTTLIKFYHERKITELSKELDRSPSAIRSKARKLKITKEVPAPKSWTEDEISSLHKYLGIRPLKRVAADLGRTVSQVRYKANELNISTQTRLLTLGDLELLFHEKIFNKNNWYKWIKLGLPVKTIGGRKSIHRRYLKAFFQQRPEAIRVYEIKDSSLEELGVDLETWPEPPVYKTIECEGWEARGKKHPVVNNKFLLYEKKCFCEKCGKRLSYWADGYTNE